MKTTRTKTTNTKYPEDYQDVFDQYILKKAIIEKYNKKEAYKVKNKKYE